MRILFVCTGNTCRSPMAAAVARQLVADRGLTNVTVESAGTGAHDGAPASDGALLVALERGVDLGEHRARSLTPALVAAADLILGMAPQHLLRAESLGGRGKSHLVSSYATDGNSTRTIIDPFGGDLATYRATYDELETDVGRVLKRATRRVRPQASPPAE